MFIEFTSPEYRKTFHLRIIVLAGGAVQSYEFRAHRRSKIAAALPTALSGAV